MTNYIEKQRYDYSLDHIREDIATAKVGEGVVEIKGKKYSTVGLRIAKLREYFGISISTEFIVHENTDDKVMVECRINLNLETCKQFLAHGFA